MSFLPAVRQQIQNRQPDDPVRITLEYLLQHAVGRSHAVPLRTLVQHLQSKGLAVTETGFQQTILAESRSSNHFIGSGPRGYFLIDTITDAQRMRDFYEDRIQAEQQNLANLKRQAMAVGWNI